MEEKKLSITSWVSIIDGEHKNRIGIVESINRKTEIMFLLIHLVNPTSGKPARWNYAYVPARYCNTLNSDELRDAIKAGRRQARTESAARRATKAAAMMLPPAQSNLFDQRPQ